MKTRFSTIDIVAIVNELQKCVGMRVNQVYDIDNKTYLIRLNRYEEKIVLLLESGMRIHTTEFEWPKNPSPSGFSMKLRKHIKNKRLESIAQIGSDRIVDLQFGINDAAYHVILELYDRGNIVLTDFNYLILNILRPRTTDSEDVKLIVRETYPVEKIKQTVSSYNREEIYSVLNEAKNGDTLKRVLMPHITFGPALLEHVLGKNGFQKNCVINEDFRTQTNMDKLFFCLEEADDLMKVIAAKPEGFLLHKVEKNNKDDSEIVTNIEFHPYLFTQFEKMRFTHFSSFDKSVDIYFSSMEGQKIDLKAFQKEKEALKKLENVKKDHENRLLKLNASQTEDIKKAQLIEVNLELVDKAILVIRSAIANQISWSDIQDLIKEAQLEGDPVAKSIKKLKLDINHFTMLLTYNHVESDDDNEDTKPQLIDIDLDCSAYANARKYYDLKRAHAKKEQKTIESSEKAFKNAEKKTKQALKEVAITTSITKARKVLWFEKFLWFISSENYLVIAGRDVQQNEMIVKKYLKGNDLYVHADIHGASSVVIKNPKGTPVPPKTLNEAGTMAVCYSTAWDAKIVTGAWWVYSNQVSKTAPSGEYLTTGSFMIRGKKNYLPPAYLIMGFGFMFKLDEESCQNHVNERYEKVDEKYEPSEDGTIETVSVEVSDSEVSDNEKSETSSVKDVESNKIEHLDLAQEEIQGQVPAIESDDPDSEEDIVSFPDTKVKLDVLSETLKPDISKFTEKAKDSESEVVVQQHKKTQKVDSNAPKSVQSNVPKNIPTVPKRGQKGKLKKIKEKYKDQDEEERRLKMEILASAGPPRERKKNKKNKEAKPRMNQVKAPKKTVHFIEILEEDTILENKEILKVEAPENVNPEVDISDEEDEETKLSDELQLLNSLTGCPLSEDVLLYAVPVCAPYSSILSYKYKVKIIPGSSRRGKAAKTALQIFQHEKAATQREKDLLRSVKDQDISRNLPGKIKISTASYKKAK